MTQREKDGEKERQEESEEGIGLLTNMSWKFPRRFSVDKTITENISVEMN